MTVLVICALIAAFAVIIGGLFLWAVVINSNLPPALAAITMAAVLVVAGLAGIAVFVGIVEIGIAAGVRP